MDFLKEIDERTIVICPINIKNKILKELNNLNRLINIKFYSLNELKKHLFFDYDVDAILYLMDNKGYTYEVAKNYIENLYYINQQEYKIAKLDFLVSLKHELISNKLLKFDKIFLECNKTTKVIVYGYDYLTSFDKKMLSNFDYKIVEKKQVNNIVPVYKFTTLEEEILFVVNEITTLVNNEVSLNNIYLLNLDSNYNNEIIRIFNMFNIPVDISVSSNLLSTVLIKRIITFLENSKSLKDSVEYFKSIMTNSTYDNELYSKIVTIFNKYIDLDYSFETIFNAIKYDLKNTSINNKTYKEMIRVSTFNNNDFRDSEYVFLLGFNQGSIPVVHKDEDYISDELKDFLGLDKVNIINKYEREATINNILAIKNLIISYKSNYLDQEFYPSNLLSNKIFKEETKAYLSTTNSYQYSLIKLSLMLDELIKYDNKSDELDKYYSSLNCRYMEYDNKYKTISKESLRDFIDNKLILSYTTIDTFYKCQFRYYLDNILKLNKYEETFDTLIGSLFHYVLSHVYDDNFDLDNLYDYYLKDKELNNKEKFYLNKLKKELKIICDRLLEFHKDTGLTNIFTEKNIKIDKSSDIEVIFKGIVDKIMYKEYDGKTLISIIDYKTGSSDIDIYDSAYGIGMQLIIYLYLITKSNLFDNYTCVGFYLQKILSSEVNIEKDKTYLEIKYNNLKLYGYSTDDVLSLERLDPTYENSVYIKSMKTTKNGFSTYSKVIDEDTMKRLSQLVDKKIDIARDKILNANFEINPKWISDDKEITGCKFCKYKDICNRKNEDIVNLKKYKDLSFLKEGDVSA